MSNVSGTIKSIQDIMRQDVGVLKMGCAENGVSVLKMGVLKMGSRCYSLLLGPEKYG